MKKKETEDKIGRLERQVSELYDLVVEQKQSIAAIRAAFEYVPNAASSIELHDAIRKITKE